MNTEAITLAENEICKLFPIGKRVTLRKSLNKKNGFKPTAKAVTGILADLITFNEPIILKTKKRGAEPHWVCSRVLNISLNGTVLLIETKRSVYELS